MSINIEFLIGILGGVYVRPKSGNDDKAIRVELFCLAFTHHNWHNIYVEDD